MGAMLRSPDELFPLLASFYALARKRDGLVVHRSLPGQVERDRERLSAAGLDVAELEHSGAMMFSEVDLAEQPEVVVAYWRTVLARALETGFSGLWFSRFALGADEHRQRDISPYEKAWDMAFRDQPVVTLCPFVLGDPDTAGERVRAQAVTHHHVRVLVSDGKRFASAPE